MKSRTADIIVALEQAPAGLTTAQIATRFKLEFNTASAKLSHLASHGYIARDFVRQTRFGPGQPPRHCIWRAKEAARA